MLKGQHRGDESIGTLCRCPLMEIKRMGRLLGHLIDGGFRQSSRNEPEVTMPKRNDQLERDVQEDAERSRQVYAWKFTT